MLAPASLGGGFNVAGPRLPPHAGGSAAAVVREWLGAWAKREFPVSFIHRLSPIRIFPSFRSSSPCWNSGMPCFSWRLRFFFVFFPTHPRSTFPVALIRESFLALWRCGVEVPASPSSTGIPAGRRSSLMTLLTAAPEYWRPTPYIESIDSVEGMLGAVNSLVDKN